MPTPGRGTISKDTSLNPQQLLDKVTSLITETTPDAQPEPAAEPVAEEPKAPESAPQPSDQPETPEDQEPEADDDGELEEVVVDGEPIQVSRAELRRNYSQHAHNTQRAQELSEKEKRLEPEIRQRVESELAQERQKWLQGAQAFQEALNELHGEPDWTEVRKLGDAEYLRQRADWEEQKVQRGRLKAEQDKVEQQQIQAQLKAHNEYLRQESDKLKAAIPEWADLEKGKAELGKLKTFVRQQYGFTDEQVQNGFTSAAIIMLVRDAAKYRELKREPNPPKVKKAEIRTARPGTPDRPRPNEAFEKKYRRLEKSGSHRDAMDIIADMID